MGSLSELWATWLMEKGSRDDMRELVHFAYTPEGAHVLVAARDGSDNTEQHMRCPGYERSFTGYPIYEWTPLLCGPVQEVRS